MTAMTLYEFNGLSKQKQMNHWALKGLYLARRHSSMHRINLYAVDCFFVEAMYDPATNTLQELRSFSSTGQLDTYLQTIRLKLP